MSTSHNNKKERIKLLQRNINCFVIVVAVANSRMMKRGYNLVEHFLFTETSRFLSCQLNGHGMGNRFCLSFIFLIFFSSKKLLPFQIFYDPVSHHHTTVSRQGQTSNCQFGGLLSTQIRKRNFKMTRKNICISLHLPVYSPLPNYHHSLLKNEIHASPT